VIDADVAASKRRLFRLRVDQRPSAGDDLVIGPPERPDPRS